MLPTAHRVATIPIVRIEQRIAAPFTALGRVETRSGALATAAVLAVIGVAASLTAANHLGELLGMSSLGRSALIAVAIAWVLVGDAVEPLGFRLRELAGSLAGEVDTYRPVAAAWLSTLRAGLLATAVVSTVVLAVAARPTAAATALLALALLASQAESVARRRAWALSDDVDPRPNDRRMGRDEELVRAVTVGSSEADPSRR